MMEPTFHILLGWSLSLALLLFTSLPADAVEVNHLKVDYMETPLGIDITTPHFSWQMADVINQRNLSQVSYRIVVKDEFGKTVWDSGIVKSDRSLGIAYSGDPLQARTRYYWSLTVLDNRGGKKSAESWFETGLMNPDVSAWKGASWIGCDANDLPFYAHYLSIFVVNYTMAVEKGSTRAAFVLCANDTRMMDRNKNLYGIASGLNGSYVKVELDVAEVLNGGNARVNVYRAGYSDKDRPSLPIASFLVKKELINASNANKPHRFSLYGELGKLEITLDDDPAFYMPHSASSASVAVSPSGTGPGYNTYGLLCDIGFSLDAGQQADFSQVEVRNKRMPQNLLRGNDFAASSLPSDHGVYHLSGGSEGFFFTVDPSCNAMPLLRTQFQVEAKPVAKARLYITSRGIYEPYLNGQRVGNEFYNPGLTQYNKTQLYQTYDVTSLLSSGTNVFGAMMGEGWWSGLLSDGVVWNHYGDRQSLLAMLEITYADGSVKTIVTNDKDWKYTNKGPIVYSSMYMGEVYDALQEQKLEGWNRPNFDDSAWQQAAVVPLDGTAFQGINEERGKKSELYYEGMKLIGQIGNAAKVYEVLTAQSVKEVRPGVFVYDMGQNLTGVPRITIHDGHAGQRITLRYSEMLYPQLKESGANSGMLMLENYCAALSQDIYIEKDGEQIVQPHFTSHGYQFVEITGIGEAIPIEDVKGVVISSLEKVTASYQSSNPKVNRLWKNLVWSNIDNFLTVPTDCPQRDERMGWSGDISVFAPTATYLSNSDPFLARHLLAMRDMQEPSGRFTDIAPVGGGFGGILWGSAGLIVPWEVYQQFGDLFLLEQHYKAMCAYIDYLNSNIDSKTGRIADAILGDWLSPQNNQLRSAYLAAAYHAYDLGIITKVAALLGKKEDAARFGKMYVERKAAFNRTFVNADKKTVSVTGEGYGQRGKTPEWKVADLQTTYAVGLALNLFSDENKPFMQRNLLEAVRRENKDDSGILRPSYSLMTGFIGTSWISKALSDCGYSDAAYRLLQTETYPSWLYPVNQGATTIWERLNGYTVENGFGGHNTMNSFNHYSFGAVGRWMIAYSLGIQRDEPGFHHFILQPEQDPSGQMTHAEGYYDSPYGRIESAWSVSDGVLTYTATVPANTTAQLYLPAQSAKSVTEGGTSASKVSGVKFLRFENGKVVYQLQSGHYSFRTTL
jgi:alpha-L-rhamnosidase